MNMCVKFRDNRIRNKNVKSIKFDVDLVFHCRRSKRELVEEKMFVNMCVKFCDVDLVFDRRRSKCELV